MERDETKDFTDIDSDQNGHPPAQEQKKPKEPNIHPFAQPYIHSIDIHDFLLKRKQRKFRHFGDYESVTSPTRSIADFAD